jgi:hypothetical protein
MDYRLPFDLYPSGKTFLRTPVFSQKKLGLKGLISKLTRNRYIGASHRINDLIIRLKQFLSQRIDIQTGPSFFSVLNFYLILRAKKIRCTSLRMFRI